MSTSLVHLKSAWQVDKALLSEEERLVMIRFGHDDNIEVQKLDEIIESVSPLVQNYAVAYLVDTRTVPDFDAMYELYDDVTLMIFWRGKHMMIDLGTGNNNKISWAFSEKQELLDILEVVYKGARKGKGLVISPRDYSSRYKY
jgi:U5 snRNP protein, DIM1 family